MLPICGAGAGFLYFFAITCVSGITQTLFDGASSSSSSQILFSVNVVLDDSEAVILAIFDGQTATEVRMGDIVQA